MTIDIARYIAWTSFYAYGILSNRKRVDDVYLDTLISDSIAGAIAYRQRGADFVTYRADLKSIAKASEINGVSGSYLWYNPLYLSEEKYLAIPQVGPLISAKQ